MNEHSAKRASTSVSTNSSRANSALMIGFFTILGALAFEYIGGYMPCELCLIQRQPYYFGLPLLIITIVFWKRIAVPPRIALTLVVAALFAWGAYMGVYHSGVEWGMWPGPTSCTGGAEGLSFGDLNSINDAKVVPCDKPEFRMFGLSFAGYNAIISSIITLLLLWSAKGQYRSPLKRC